MKNTKILVYCISGVLNLPFFAIAADSTADNINSNQEVLDNWKQQTGQEAAIVNSSSGSSLEWHGQVTEDLYNVDTSSNARDAALTGLREGTFSLTNLQGDLRSTSQAGDITYVQGGASLTQDRSKQSLYRSQITNLQFGRAGNGYQVSGGDVVADFSKIGSNLGLRGIYGAKQANATKLYGYAGVVSESWESLFNRNTLTNQPPRNRYLRDVVGAKVDHQINQSWSLFGTAQTYSDRRSSIDAIAAAVLIAQNGTTGTVGLGYKTDKANIAIEVGVSHNDFNAASTQSFGDSAVLIDAGYSWQTVNVRAGYHDIGSHYTSLSQVSQPGIRERYIGGDWYVTPSLSYVNDIRRSETRTASIFGGPDALNKVNTLVNRLSYNVTQLPGLNISIQDMRNWNKSELNNSRNASTQLNTFYSTQHYTSGLTLGNAKQKASSNPLSDNITNSVQLTLGRQILAGELLVLPSLSGGIQFNGGYQQQRIANNTQTSSGSQGVNINVQSQKIGVVQLSITNVDTRQPNNALMLNTKVIGFDWNKSFSDALTFKAYVHNSYRNHGDLIQKVDEKIVGLTADYLW